VRAAQHRRPGRRADFVDVPTGVTHNVRALELGVPFVSSIPSEREIHVEPRLAFTLDGSRFDSAAIATPFAERGDGEATIKLDRFDIAPWLGYLPKTLPVRLQSGLLSADLVLAFAQRPTLSLQVRGSVGVADLKVADASRRSCSGSAASRCRSRTCVRSRGARSWRGSTSTRRTCSRCATAPAAST
jgi:hypothetical protein